MNDAALFMGSDNSSKVRFSSLLALKKLIDKRGEAYQRVCCQD